MKAATQKKGQVTIRGDRMVIAFAPAHFSRDDLCDRAGNYKKTLPAETQTLQWALKTKYGEQFLCFTEKNGEESCFSK